MAINNKETWDSFISNYRWLENKSLEIYRFINNDSTYRVMLRYNPSIYNGFEIKEDNIRIYYIDYNERDCMSFIDIPYKYFYYTNYQDYILELYKSWKEKDDELRRQLELRREGKERELYEKLKLKFEKKGEE